MAGKAYIKTGDYTWSRVKKVYLKTGGITWQAIRKAYIKTGTSTWKKIYDTASNKPFIGNDIPKIRLNTPRTNSDLDFTGTANDPVNPVVEAPPVQQMGPPTTTPTTGWPSTSLGNHLWGYNGGWISGNGSAISYIYQWLYNLTGNSNDNIFDPQFYVSATSSSRNTSSTGRADMLTNSASYLGYDDGDYFDKNFLTFRVGASNSAGGPVFAESAPVYIVRKRPSGTIDLTNTNVDAPETLYANFTYQDDWYNKPDLYDSYIEWFAVDSASEALTASNRVEIQDLYTFTVTGTTTKSGTASYYATLPGKYYAARLTLNNSNTQSPVIPVSGFTPTSPFTAEDSTAPGSALEVSTLDILDIYGNAGTDNRDYIPAGGLMKIKSEVTGVDGSTTYRIRYRMYNWQNNSYYGMDGTNYGSAASSAWTTKTGSSTSFGPGGTLISDISVSGTTATLIHNEVISSFLFGSTTFAPGNQDRWSIDIEVSALKNSIRKYYADLVGGAVWYISRSAANLLFTPSPASAQVNSNVTFSGSIGALGGGSSYPRQYRVVWGPGDVTEWLPVNEWSYGTANPTFTITKQFSTAGEYYPYFQTIPDYSNGATSIVISPALSAPTPTGVIWNGTSFVISYTGGSGPWFQSWYRADNTTYPSDGTGYDSGSATQNTSTITYTPGFTPTPGSTYSFWVRSALESNSNTVSTVSSYSTTRVDVAIPQVATAPTSVTASNNGSSTTLTATWSGSTFATKYRIYWTSSPTAPDPATSYDKEKNVGESGITSTSGFWAWSPSDRDKNNFAPSVGSNYYFYVSASANGTTWTPYVRTSATVTLALIPPNIDLVTPGVQGGPVSVSFSGGSGPFYQAYWTGNTAPTTSVTPDASGQFSPLTDNTGPTSTGTVYMYVRSVTTLTDSSAGASSTASAWSTGIPFNMTSNAVVQSTAPTAKATGTNSTTIVKYLDSITWSGGTYTNASTITSTLRYSTQTSLLVAPDGNVDSNTSFRSTSPYVIQTSDPAGMPYYFAVRDKVVGVNGTTYYFYSNQILSAKADGVAFSYGTATSATGGWTASISGTSQSGASYSYVSATAGSGTVNSTTGAITATGLTSGASSTVTVSKTVSGYSDITSTGNGTASTVVTYTLTYSANSGSSTPLPQTGASGSTITLASGAGTRSGFTFGGWNISGTTYSAGGSYTFGSADATATAIWTANFVTPTAPPPSWSSGSNFQRISGSSILRWYTDYPAISGNGTITGMQFQIRTAAGGGTLLADSTRSYPGAGSYPYSGGGTVWAFRCGTSDGDISYSSSARFARARVVMLGTNGTTYYGTYSGWI
jgi:hypothetical protein